MRVHSREFRLHAVRRILAGEKVATVSQDLGIHRKLLYEWLHRVVEGGEDNLRQRGRPSKPREQPSPFDSPPMAELERTLAYQEQVIDFFGHALPHAVSSRRCRQEVRTGKGNGATASIKPSNG